MLRLFDRGYAQDFDLEKPALGGRWPTFRTHLLQRLDRMGSELAKQYLEDLPFELFEADNGFGDEFFVLFARVDLDKYQELLQCENKRPFGIIANELGRILPGERGVRFVAVDWDDGYAATTPVATPVLQVTSDAVDRALNDAEHLINSQQGAPSAIDRAQTALHGYLFGLCEEAGIQADRLERATSLFSKLRQQHPKLAYVGPRDEEIDRIIKACSTIVDATLTLRNNVSGAHPNPQALPAPEAMLMINVIRTLLHYIESKVRS